MLQEEKEKNNAEIEQLDRKDKEYPEFPTLRRAKKNPRKDCSKERSRKKMVVGCSPKPVRADSWNANVRIC